MLTAAECRTYKQFVDKYQPFLYPLLGARLGRICGELEGPIVDMGTGPGYLTVELARRMKGKVHAVDINPAMHEMAEELARSRGVLERVSFDLVDVHALPYPTSYADLVVSYSCFHHWAEPIQAMRECYRILAPGGRLILIDTKPEVGDAIEILRRTIVEPELFRFVEEALAESYRVEQVHDVVKAAGIRDYTIIDFDFEEADLMECLDLLDDSAFTDEVPERGAMSWLFEARKPAT